MKIHQLPMNARFEYEGREYVKTGPQVASGPEGQRMIPRYAVLMPLDGLPAVPATAQETAMLPRERARAACEAFAARCAPWVPVEHREEFEAARAECLRVFD